MCSIVRKVMEISVEGRNTKNDREYDRYTRDDVADETDKRSCMKHKILESIQIKRKYTYID